MVVSVHSHLCANSHLTVIMGWTNSGNILTEEKYFDPKTKLTSLFRFLLKIKVFPARVDETTKRLRFLFFSKEMLGYITIITIWFLPNIGLQVILNGAKDFFRKYAENSNSIDLLSVLGHLFFGTVLQVNPILITKDMTLISSDIILSDHLHWPRHGLKLVAAFPCYVIGLILLNSPLILQALAFVEASMTTYFIAISIFISTWIFTYILVAFLPFLFLTSWMEKFGEICRNRNTDSTINHIMKCNQIYDSFQRGFGSFYLLNFTVNQIIQILSFYSMISIWLKGDNNKRRWIQNSLVHSNWSRGFGTQNTPIIPPLVFCLLVLYGIP